MARSVQTAIALQAGKVLCRSFFRSFQAQSQAFQAQSQEVPVETAARGWPCLSTALAGQGDKGWTVAALQAGAVECRLSPAAAALVPGGEAGLVQVRESLRSNTQCGPNTQILSTVRMKTVTCSGRAIAQAAKLGAGACEDWLSHMTLWVLHTHVLSVQRLSVPVLHLILLFTEMGRPDHGTMTKHTSALLT